MTASSEQPAELLLRHVRPVPLGAHEARPDHAVDVHLAGGRVVDIGHDLARRTPGVAQYDAEGRWLIPGLWDAHVHLGQWSVASQRLDVSGAGSPEEVVRRVAARLAEEPELPVVGFGHRSARWHRRARVQDLDEVAPHTPVVLISGDAHHAWMNTTALMMLALPLRDEVVSEAEWFAAYARLGTITGDDGNSPAAYRRAMQQAAAQGIVGLTDFEFSGGADDWRARWAAGADRVRVRMATYADGLEAVIAEGLHTGAPLGDDPRLTMGPLKIISDGSLNTRTAWCTAPYADADQLVSPAGHPNLSADELQGLLRRAASRGLGVATHAIGDAAVQEALIAYETTGARGSIEHAQLVGEADVRRMAELGVLASVQPAHLLDDREVTEFCWPDRTDRCFALRWMVEAGVTLRMGSDAPVAPLDPWLAIAAAVHRGAPDEEPWHPEQALSPREALAASTDGWGTVAVGHPADLALLDDDPLRGGDDTAAAARALRAMPVHATWVAGEQVHGHA